MWIFVVICMFENGISCHHPMEAARAARRSLLIWMGAEADGKQPLWSIYMVYVESLSRSMSLLTQGFDLLKRMVVLLYHFFKMPHANRTECTLSCYAGALAVVGLSAGIQRLPLATRCLDGQKPRGHQAVNSDR